MNFNQYALIKWKSSEMPSLSGITRVWQKRTTSGKLILILFLFLWACNWMQAGNIIIICRSFSVQSWNSCETSNFYYFSSAKTLKFWNGSDLWRWLLCFVWLFYVALCLHYHKTPKKLLFGSKKKKKLTSNLIIIAQN